MSRVCSYCQSRAADKMVQAGTVKRWMCDHCITRRVSLGQKMRIFKQGEPK